MFCIAKEAQDEIKAATPQVQVDEPEQEDDDDDGVLEERENLKTEEDYLKVDYEDEMRRLNKYLLAAQCHAIQKEQRRLKKQVQKTVKAENMRIHNIMEQERRQAIIKEMEKEAIRRQNCMELGKFQRQQIEEKREQKKREQEQEIQLLDTLKKQQEERYKVDTSFLLIQDALVYEKEKQQRLKQEEIKQNSDVCEK
ncbi:golgin subfamily A member 6-like protein 6 [Polypterus senegalus]|uniref:golgin subfamily A member 6-like protein 6 n=1 Tax=Polypterus senegalus TaxID=55291 RepID=UPI0019643343|nr:golgin subfamily A member 6-like protein 6 [Polypterus senegalus]